MVNVTDGADVAVRLVALEFSLSHFSTRLLGGNLPRFTTSGSRRGGSPGRPGRHGVQNT
jgi:hypothetical protein